MIAFILGITFFIIGMVETGPAGLVRNAALFICIMLAIVPEGLLVTVTVSLIVRAQRMKEKNVRVKNLESVETLGSTSVICSDKTGTLTTNVMTCQHVFFDLEERECDTAIPMMALKGDFYVDGTVRKQGFLKLIRCGALCNNAQFELDQNGNTKTTNDSNPTEAAMLKFSWGHIQAENPNQSIDEYRASHKKEHEIPFNSKNKWQVGVHRLKRDNLLDCEKKMDDVDIGDYDEVPLVQMKGAPERILALCDRYFYEGEVLDLDDQRREAILRGNEALAARGERVLALAELVLDPQKYDITVPEPEIDRKYPEDVDESMKDGVIVMYDGTRHKVKVDPRDEDTNEPIPWEEALVWMSR